MSTASQEFLRKAAEKSADLVHRGIVRWNIDQYDTGVGKGKTRFADWEAARQRCHDIKWEAVNHLDKYLLQFEQKVKKTAGTSSGRKTVKRRDSTSARWRSAVA